MQFLSALEPSESLQKIGLQQGTRRLITCAANDGSLRLWQIAEDYRSCRRLAQIDWPEQPTANRMRLNPKSLPQFLDGRLVNTSVDIAFHPIHDVFACIGPKGAVELRHWPTCSITKVLGDPGQFARLAFTPDGTTLVASGWVEFENGRPQNCAAVMTYPEGVITGVIRRTGRAIAFHPEGRILASGINDHGTCQIRWTLLQDGYPVLHRIAEIYTEAQSLAFDRIGKSLTVCGEDEAATLHVLDVLTSTVRFRRELSSAEATSRVYRLHRECAFSADASRLWCPLDTGEIMEVDAYSGAQLSILKVSDAPVVSIAIDYVLDIMVMGDVTGRIILFKIDSDRSVLKNPRSGESTTERLMRESQLLPENADATSFEIVCEY